jgi:hypothetical protein
MKENIFFQIASRNFSSNSISRILQFRTGEIFGGLLSGDIVMIDKQSRIVVYQNVSILCFFSVLLGVYHNIPNMPVYEVEDLNQDYLFRITIKDQNLYLEDEDSGVTLEYEIEAFHKICSIRLEALRHYFFLLYRDIGQHKDIKKINDFFEMPSIARLYGNS